jgi:hypothetical protein
VNNDWIISTSAGITLIGVGVTLMRSHIHSWDAKKNDATLGEKERRYLHSRFRRRMQASAILAALGVLIPLGDIAIPWQQFPGLFAVYWGFVLLLALWVILLGMADVLATSAHTRAELGRIRRRQRELEAKVAELRRRGSNGRDRSSRDD